MSERLAKLQVTKLDRTTGTESLISVDRFFLDHAKLYSLVMKRRALLPSDDVVQERLTERERERATLKSSRFGAGMDHAQAAAARRDVTPLPPPGDPDSTVTPHGPTPLFLPYTASPSNLPSHSLAYPYSHAPRPSATDLGHATYASARADARRQAEVLYLFLQP